MAKFVNRLLLLERNEGRKLVPFFFLYLLLFASVTLADGVALTLFIKRLGSEMLPQYYGITAFGNLIFISGYLLIVDRISSAKLLSMISVLSCLPFLIFSIFEPKLSEFSFIYGILLIMRELVTVLTLLHFGNLLQDYFNREELKRVTPPIYSGGRLGGLLGASLLAGLSPMIGVVNLGYVLLVIVLFTLALIIRIERKVHLIREDSESEDAPTNKREIRKFIKFTMSSYLAIVLILSSVIFTICRWILNFQSNAFFESYFTDEVSMAKFIGLYTQIALLIAMFLQLIIVPRLIHYFGVAGNYTVYSVLMALSFFFNFGQMNLAIAVFARFVEYELRYSIRNPAMQLLTNELPRRFRKKLRAVNMGLVIPFATGMVSAILVYLQNHAWVEAVSFFGIAMGLAYLFSSIAIFRIPFKKKRKSS